MSGSEHGEPGIRRSFYVLAKFFVPAQREYVEGNAAHIHPCTYLFTILLANLGAEYLLSSYEATVLHDSVRITWEGIVSTGIWESSYGSFEEMIANQKLDIPWDPILFLFNCMHAAHRLQSESIVTAQSIATTRFASNTGSCKVTRLNLCYALFSYVAKLPIDSNLPVCRCFDRTRRRNEHRRFVFKGTLVDGSKIFRAVKFKKLRRNIHSFRSILFERCSKASKIRRYNIRMYMLEEKFQ